jgi:hypothetical protein
MSRNTVKDNKQKRLRRASQLRWLKKKAAEKAKKI